MSWHSSWGVFTPQARMWRLPEDLPWTGALHAQLLMLVDASNLNQLLVAKPRLLPTHIITVDLVSWVLSSFSSLLRCTIVQLVEMVGWKQCLVNVSTWQCIFAFLAVDCLSSQWLLRKASEGSNASNLKSGIGPEVNRCLGRASCRHSFRIVGYCQLSIGPSCYPEINMHLPDVCLLPVEGRASFITSRPNVNPIHSILCTSGLKHSKRKNRQMEVNWTQLMSSIGVLHIHGYSLSQQLVAILDDSPGLLAVIRWQRGQTDQPNFWWKELEAAWVPTLPRILSCLTTGSFPVSS